MKNTEATLLYLRLIKSVLIAYVNEDSSVRQRIFHAVYAVHFIRIWRQWLHNNNISTKHFMTKNSWEGLEINLILLLQFSLENKSENIYFHNSQVNESFFRLLRSYTGMENMVVNVSMKGFISRVHKIELEEFLMSDLSLSNKFKFPKVIANQSYKQNPKLI